jgi:hypothetical protein
MGTGEAIMMRGLVQKSNQTQDDSTPPETELVWVISCELLPTNPIATER